jgi:DNA polymerase III epsilon subunit-like protein
MEKQPMTNIAFVDTETTHLDAEIGEVWEVAIILRESDDNTPTDTEYVWQVRPDLATADPESLKIGRYLERFVVPPHAEAAWTGYDQGPVLPMMRREVVAAVMDVLRGAVLVGSNPGFDDRFLRKFLGPGSAQWHYRPVDVATLVAGARFGMASVIRAALPLVGSKDVPTFPFSSREMSRFVGVEPPSDDVAHTALGDARWARDVFDAVTGGAR